MQDRYPTISFSHKSQSRPIGKLRSDAVIIYIRDEILDQIFDYSEADLKRERGGFLLGKHYSEGEQEHIEINTFLPAKATNNHAASLTFTHQTWSYLHQERDEKYSDQAILGWQHTHPDFGIFLSGYDKFIHHHFFSHPWQVACVVDPVRQEVGFFQWQHEKIVDCGFVCLH